MKWLRFLAAGSVVAGIAVLVLALVARGADSGSQATLFIPVAETPRVVATGSPVPTVPAPQTVLPSPSPYDGPVQRLLIPRFGVDSAVEAIGLVPGENQLDVPKDPLKTGWYDIYDRPGFDGNAVFSAHVDYYPNIRGPFYELASLEAGDEILIEMANGDTYRYRVFSKQRYAISEIPTGDLIDAPTKPEGAEWITLITCGGRFRALNPDGSGPGEYLDRDVVVAERVGT